MSLAEQQPRETTSEGQINAAYERAQTFLADATDEHPNRLHVVTDFIEGLQTSAAIAQEARDQNRLHAGISDEHLHDRYQIVQQRTELRIKNNPLYAEARGEFMKNFGETILGLEKQDNPGMDTPELKLQIADRLQRQIEAKKKGTPKAPAA